MFCLIRYIISSRSFLIFKTCTLQSIIIYRIAFLPRFYSLFINFNLFSYHNYHVLFVSSHFYDTIKKIYKIEKKNKKTTFFFVLVKVIKCIRMAAYYLSKDKQAELAQIAQTIATPGKGILAADESAGLLDI